jgi:hypothetical protein
MRIELRNISGDEVRIDLSGGRGAGEGLVLRAVTFLQGTLTTGAAGTVISDCLADLGTLESCRLKFEAVTLVLNAPCVISRFSGDLSLGEELHLDVRADQLKTGAIEVCIGGARFSSSMLVRDCSLRLKGEEGELHMAYAELNGFALHDAAAGLKAPHVVVQGLSLFWSATGFRSRADALRAGEVTLAPTVPALQLDGLLAKQVDFRDGVLSCSELKCEHVRGDVALPWPPPLAGGGVARGNGRNAQRTGPVVSRQPAFDAALVDGLSGRLHCDVAVGMDIAVVPRRAVHRLRLDVNRGLIDYRLLEAGLSRLEDALLDFSVREKHLVLELGLPFIPMRGRGMPLVRWSLTPDDLRLAQQGLVPLRLLPFPDSKERSQDDAPDEELGGPGLLRLRELDIKNLDLELALEALPRAEGTSLQALSVAAFHVEGGLTLRDGGARWVGKLSAFARDSRAALVGLALGGQALSATKVRVLAVEATWQLDSAKGISQVAYELTGVEIGELGVVPHPSAGPG